jgi:CheY-like chemotaxis protein
MPKRILGADDDAGIGEMLHLMLEEAGYGVEIQADGHAVELLQEPLPDLLILDIRLSGVNGGNICRWLKSQAATRHIPIILLSASKETQQIAREAGAAQDHCLPWNALTGCRLRGGASW